MASHSLTTVSAPTNPIEYVAVPTADGVVALVQASAVAVWRAQGRTAVNLRLLVELPNTRSGRLISATQAAAQLMDAVDGMTMTNARSKISRACSHGAIKFEAIGRSRFLDPDSFAAWLNAERTKNLES